MSIDEFAPCDNYSNHRALLWLALEATTGPVLELGMGDGSTPYLHEFCGSTGRQLVSVDSDPAWTSKFNHLSTGHHSIICCDGNWDQIYETFKGMWSVVLVDHAPGERRHVDIRRLASLAEVIVIHDTEPIPSSGYLLDMIWHLFKSRVDVKANGAWASAVSNFIDLNSWVDLKIGKYEIS